MSNFNKLFLERYPNESDLPVNLSKRAKKRIFQLLTREDLPLKASQVELRAIKVPERYSSLEVASRIRLPSKSNFATALDLDLTPYSKLPIFCIGKEQILWIIVIAPTQSGKTVILQVAVADTIDQAPNTAIYCLPDEKSGAKALDEKVIEMIKCSPFLQKYIQQPASKTLSKVAIRLVHMTIYPAWSNSLAALSSTPAARVFADEVRLFKKSVGKESNALKLLADRMTTFRAMGMAQGYIVSTPSNTDDLLYMQTKLKGTTILWWYVPCPKCHKYQILDFFTNIKKPQNNEPIKCTCKFCEEGVFGDKDKKVSWNSKGKYGFAGQEGKYEVYLSENSPVTMTQVLSGESELPIKGRVVFRFDSMVSPFRPFQMIWDEFIETKDNPEDFKNFWQAWLARFWEMVKSMLDRGDLEERIGVIARGIVPQECKTVIAGADTQDDGFYVTFRAYGHNGEVWLIDNCFLPCALSTATEEQLIQVLGEGIENRLFYAEDNTPWMVAYWSIDTGGHRTKAIYAAFRRLQRVYLIKGASPTQDKDIQESNNIDYLYLVRTDSYAQQTEDLCTKEIWHLYEKCDSEYLTQFLNYKKVEELQKNGKTKIVWTKVGQQDYRMADIHCYITLDIAENNGLTFRQNLSVANWSYNPIQVKQVVAKESRESDLLVKGQVDETYLGDYGPNYENNNDFGGGYFGN